MYLKCNITRPRIFKFAVSLLSVDEILLFSGSVSKTRMCTRADHKVLRVQKMQLFVEGKHVQRGYSTNERIGEVKA